MKRMITIINISLLFMVFLVMCKCQTTGGRKCIDGNCNDGFGEQITEFPYKNKDGSERYVLYKGEFLNGLRHGKGTLDLRKTEGDFYEGEFQNDRYHGYGVWTRLDSVAWPEEENDIAPSRYEGNFVEGVPHGEGTLTTRSGKKYSGRFIGGGLCYKGNCEDGYGEQIFWNGSHYQGEYKAGKENGKGTGYDSNNHVRYTGGHKDGEYEGYGVEINYWSKYENGIERYRPATRYEGMYIDGFWNGKGKIYYLESGKTEEGIWDGVGNCKGPKC